MLKATLEDAQIEFYDDGAVIFLKRRIGIITTGSVLIRKHSNNDI